MALALLAMAAGGGVTPARSWAGDYHVYACRPPSGESAPADGWSGSNTGPERRSPKTVRSAGGRTDRGAPRRNQPDGQRRFRDLDVRGAVR